MTTIESAFMHSIVGIVMTVSALFPSTAMAGDTVTIPQYPTDDFVIASLLIASPGQDIYYSVGHAALRLQCPDHGLDFIFSAEGGWKTQA